jgi:hypothetical protein
MKKVLFIFFGVVVLLSGISSCKKVANAIFKGFEVSVPDIQIALKEIPIVSPFEIPIGQFPYKFNLDSVVRSKTAGVFGANDVSSIKVKQFNINITNADQQNNISNFQSLRVTLQSNTNNNPAEIFSAVFPDTYAATFTAPGNDTELLSYLKGSDIVYNMYAKNRRITTKPLSIIISVTIRTK